jgi:serpin B
MLKPRSLSRSARKAVAALTLALIAIAAYAAASTAGDSSRRVAGAAAGGASAASAASAAPPTTPRPTPGTPTPGTASIVHSGNQLALDLLRRLGAGGNVVFSPYSIETALAMAHAGAGGETEAQIARVLHAAGGRKALLGGLKALASRLADATRRKPRTPAADAVELRLANGLWVQSGLALRPPFARSLSQTFGAAPQPVEFKARFETARQAINAWVADHTGKRINDLMAPGTIDTRTRLVLANAIYVKAHWSSPFNPALTATRSFTVGPGRRVPVPFMTQAPTPISYGHGPGYQAVDLPYLHSTLSLLVVMPSAGTVAAFARRLSADSLARLAASLRRTVVDLRMPRFHLGTHADLNQPLAALGMPLAFSDHADFSGITAQVPLTISHVAHGADLTADEQGTVAVAATGISFTPTSVLVGRPTHLALDHPFLLFLRDSESGAILFAGRLADPSKSSQ